MNIVKGDTVVVISGDARDVGKRGRVISVDRQKNRVLVEGVNIVKKHLKPSQSNQQGGIVEKEAPVHVSNVMAWCESASRPSKIKRKRLEDGTRVRVYAINGETVEQKK